LLRLNAKLKTNFLLSIKVFSNLIEMRGGGLAGHALRVADLARKLAVQIGCDESTVQDVFVAAMLHNIGQICLSDELLTLPQTAMSGEQLGKYRKHPVRAEQLLMPLDELRGAALLVRAHQERFDGTGYPDQLTGQAIPLGARILALPRLRQAANRHDDAKKTASRRSLYRYPPQSRQAL
jgi:response regulator RpfG family c-di-GMP phosphodiesterase